MNVSYYEGECQLKNEMWVEKRNDSERFLLFFTKTRPRYYLTSRYGSFGPFDRRYEVEAYAFQAGIKLSPAPTETPSQGTPKR